jgi:hypothetical protein
MNELDMEKKSSTANDRLQLLHARKFYRKQYLQVQF